MASEVMLNCH